MQSFYELRKQKINKKNPHYYLILTIGGLEMIEMWRKS